MGPQTPLPESEDNLPRDGDGSGQGLPPLPAGTFAGFGEEDEDGSSGGEEEEEDVDRGGYMPLDQDLEEMEGSEDDTAQTHQSITHPTFNHPTSFQPSPIHDQPSDNQDQAMNFADFQAHFPANPELTTTFLPTGGVPAADAHFLAGAAHLLPRSLRDISPPRVASLQENVIDVWGAGRPPSQSASDPSKIEAIRQAMSRISLPSTAVPEWASSLSDDDWRKALNDKLNFDHK